MTTQDQKDQHIKQLQDLLRNERAAHERTKLRLEWAHGQLEQIALIAGETQ